MPHLKFNMESTKINYGPESPADFKWSQGAKNPRKETQTNDSNTNDQRTLASDTNDFNQTGAETSYDEICADNIRTDGPPIRDTTVTSTKRMLFPKNRFKRKRVKRKLIRAIQSGRTDLNDPMFKQLNPTAVCHALQPPKLWYKEKLRSNNLIFAEIKENPYLVAIMGGGNKQGKLTEEQSNIIIRKITERICIVSEEIVCPKIQNFTLKDGFLLISCFDEATTGWIKKEKFLDLWEGGTAMALCRRDFEKKFHYETFMAQSYLSSKDFLKLLGIQNPKLNVSNNFDITRRIVERPHGTFYGVVVKKCCLERLQGLKMRPYCGLGRVNIGFRGVKKSRFSIEKQIEGRFSSNLSLNAELEEFKQKLLQSSKLNVHLTKPIDRGRGIADNLPNRQSQINRYPQSYDQPGTSNVRPSQTSEITESFSLESIKPRYNFEARTGPAVRAEGGRFEKNILQTSKPEMHLTKPNYQGRDMFGNFPPQRQPQVNRYLQSSNQQRNPLVSSDVRPSQTSKKPVLRRLGSPQYPPPKYDGTMTFSEYFESLKGSYWHSSGNLPSDNLDRYDEVSDEPRRVDPSRSCELYQDHEEYYDSDRFSPEIYQTATNDLQDNEYDPEVEVEPADWQNYPDNVDYVDPSRPQPNSSSVGRNSRYNLPSKKQNYPTTSKQSGYWFTENTLSKEVPLRQSDSSAYPAVRDTTTKNRESLKRYDLTEYLDINRPREYDTSKSSNLSKSPSSSTQNPYYIEAENYLRSKNLYSSNYSSEGDLASRQRNAQKFCESSKYSSSSTQHPYQTEAERIIENENSYSSRYPEEGFLSRERDTSTKYSDPSDCPSSLTQYPYNTEPERYTQNENSRRLESQYPDSSNRQYTEAERYLESSRVRSSNQHDSYRRSEPLNVGQTSRQQESLGRFDNPRYAEPSRHSNVSSTHDKYSTEAERYVESPRRQGSSKYVDSARPVAEKFLESSRIERGPKHERYSEDERYSSRRSNTSRERESKLTEAERFLEWFRGSNTSREREPKLTDAERYLEASRRTNISREREPKLTEAERFSESFRRSNTSRERGRKLTEAERFLESSRRSDSSREREPKLIGAERFLESSRRSDSSREREPKLIGAERVLESSRRSDSSRERQPKLIGAERFLESSRINTFREREPKLTEAERFLESSRRSNTSREQGSKLTGSRRYLESSGSHSTTEREPKLTDAERFLTSSRKSNVSIEREQMSEAERFVQPFRRYDNPRGHNPRKLEADRFSEHSKRDSSQRRFAPY